LTAFLKNALVDAKIREHTGRTRRLGRGQGELRLRYRRTAGLVIISPEEASPAWLPVESWSPLGVGVA